MSRKYLKALSRAATMALRTFGEKNGEFYETRYEKAKAHNKAVLQNIFNGLLDESISLAFIRTGKLGNSNLIVYTRSAKNVGTIQRTAIWERGGELIPISDQQYTTFMEMWRGEHVGGHYVNIS